MLSSQINKVFFLGVGGIGMSALARYVYNMDYRIAGYDKVKTNLTQEIESLGSVCYEDAPHLLPREFHDVDRTLVVYTPAVPKNSGLFKYFEDNQYRMVKRAAFLGMLSGQYNTIAVGGAHGKTSTSALITHLLNQRTEKVNGIIGGICANYRSNFVWSNESNDLVTEADEFDRSFLHLSPNTAVITSWDIDHLDVYQDQLDFIETSLEFVQKAQNRYICFNALKEYQALPFEFTSYGLDPSADVHPEHYEWKGNAWHFRLKIGSKIAGEFKSYFPGTYALENTIVAIAIALEHGMDCEQIQKAINTYEGVLRRFQLKFKQENKLLIEDYAHHPTEIEAFLNGVEMAYPDQKKYLIFQAHLYSRTQDFEKEFLQVLSQFNGEVWLTPIYAARELPIPGVDTKNWLKTLKNARFGTMDEAVMDLKDLEEGLVLVVGAGDVYQVSDDLIKEWNKIEK